MSDDLEEFQYKFILNVFPFVLSIDISKGQKAYSTRMPDFVILCKKGLSLTWAH